MTLASENYLQLPIGEILSPHIWCDWMEESFRCPGIELQVHETAFFKVSSCTLMYVSWPMICRNGFEPTTFWIVSQKLEWLPVVGFYTTTGSARLLTADS